LKDLEAIIGRPDRVYGVLSRKRPLTLAMIRRLHKSLGIPALFGSTWSLTKRALNRALTWSVRPCMSDGVREWRFCLDDMIALCDVRRQVHPGPVVQ
jgi:hypothetical protein